ncbi:ABC transporter ATP-binding protein [Aquipluma nitroreducens]|uniref:Probable ATP-binding protein YbiT n=1 Tax=Aquipluma nitroreducens TaxID=2010828 RepID=A0A5K7SFZ7_9BACT|nr:ATP-binding cassette domain-containing protein [Aquipluma nitroreducens]MDD2306009.1 ATP-binding cassette domain-containing protein [Prolixibacteraceae bacterium]BBE20511.1 ABC transporter ATP-binding protein [Aquipluma nitroreducens]
MISVDQLVVSFGGFELFKGITLLVSPKDRIGLVGKNGAGKSTLLKILAGHQQPNEGVVSVPSDVRLGYLPQHMEVFDGRTVFEEAVTSFEEILDLERRIEDLNHQISTRTDYESDEYHRLLDHVTEFNERFHMLGGNNFEAEVERTLIGLGFKRTDFTRQTSEFSGGWRMRIELAKILLKRPDVFLLDEPTNHLDIESIQWLEDFLRTYNGAVVLVSHDRAFLDAITNRTVEITLGRIYDFKSNYSKYLILRKELKETQMAAYINQQKMIADTEEFIARFRYQATKAVQVQSRIKALDRLERLEVDEEDNSALRIKFPPALRSGTVVAEIRELTKNYGKLNVLKEIDLTIERGEKVAFVGKNGEGKTTLARIIMSELEYEGEMKLGHNVKIGYYAQNQANLLDPELTVFDTIDRIAVGEIRTKIRNILGGFMFSGEDADKKVKVLSGGERSRLAMVKLMLEPVNLLVLDEPTNHLDMRSKEILKQALIDYDGTIIVVSHDREFLDGLVNCVYEFKDKKVKQHLGGIYEFLRRKKIDSMKELEKKDLPLNQEVKIQKTEEAEKVSFDERKEINKNINKLEKSIEKNELEISGLEQKIAEMDKTLAETNGSDPEIFKKYDRLKKELENKMYEWEILHEQLDELSAKKTW